MILLGYEELKEVFFNRQILNEPSDIEFWNEEYIKREKAIEKFGFISMDYEEIKNEARNDNRTEDMIYGYWCRSLVGNDYSLDHPTYLEYKDAFIRRDKEWLPTGYTYVKLDLYRKEKK